MVVYLNIVQYIVRISEHYSDQTLYIYVYNICSAQSSIYTVKVVRKRMMHTLLAERAQRVQPQSGHQN